MNQNIRKGLDRQKKILEAQIREAHCSLPVLEASRLDIRTSLPADDVSRFWTISQEVLTNQTRTLMAFVAEHYQIQKKMERLDQIQSSEPGQFPDPPTGDQ